MSLPQTRRTREWHRPLTALVLAIALLLAPTLTAADADDDLFSDEPAEEFTDDFLEEDYVEPEAEAPKGLVHWGFYVPVDVLISRPFAFTDTAVGGMFLAVSSPILAGFSAGKSGVDWAVGDGWYFDTGNLQAALQICIQDPWEYAWNRPLGQLSSEY